MTFKVPPGIKIQRVSQRRGIWPFRVATYTVSRVGNALATEELLTGSFLDAEHALRAALSSESKEVSPTSPGRKTTGVEDRPFRPDIEGLRAVAVALVVLFHAGVVPMAGGYVGVDVFFVLSGFLITGLLIRERLTSDSTSLPRFYARRVRRILPAATLVLFVTILASYQWLGFLRANTIALDGQWTAVFGANLHFALEGTQYLNNLAPPSPLQHYWSLAVEEQFYLVWPLLFLIIAGKGRGAPLRVKLAVALGIIITASFAWSIIQTSRDGNWAFFSPLTRAWELAIGAMLTVSIPVLLRIPRSTGPWISWAGLACVISSAFLLDGNTPFPGYAASLPVLGSAAVIIGGTVKPGGGSEVLLARAPFQWLGKLSYSLYLWHWPLLIIPAQATGNVLSLPQNLGLVAIAVLLSVVTYHLAENPIRRSMVLQKKTFASLSLGLFLVLASYALGRWEIQAHRTRPAVQAGLPSPTAAFAAATPPDRTTASPVATVSASPLAAHSPSAEPTANCARPIDASLASTSELSPAVPLADVLCLVAAAPAIKALPSDLVPPLEVAEKDFSLPGAWVCEAGDDVAEVPDCVYGDPGGARTLLLLGDSHASAWLPAFDQVGKRLHWKVIILAKGACTPAYMSTYQTRRKIPFADCDRWHDYVIARINRTHPDLLVISTVSNASTGPGQGASPADWKVALKKTLSLITIPNTRKVLLANLPTVKSGNPPDQRTGTNCLAAHLSDVQACSAPREVSVLATFQPQEREAAKEIGGRYVDVNPWLCSQLVCTAVIGKMNVYVQGGHLSATYATYLSGALQAELQPLMENP